MILRDALAAALVVAGVASVSFGASLIAPAAGFIILGILLLGLGIALGVGERGEEVEEPAPAAIPVPVSVAAAEEPTERTDSGESSPGPAVNPRHPSTGPTVVPLASYVGVRGEEDSS